MAESSSFSSLLDLVDNHLSKIKIDNNGSFKLPTLRLSEQNITTKRGQSSANSEVKDDSITTVLAYQVENMLKNQELQKQQEKKVAVEREEIEKNISEISLNEDNDYIIDLEAAIKVPYVHVPFNTKDNVDNDNFWDSEQKSSRAQTSEANLPCTTDMSHILYKKVMKVKCSTFGKVLLARVKPVAAPYLHEKIVSKVKRFDFSTKSPCDLVKEKMMWKPKCHKSFDIPELMKVIMSDDFEGTK